MASHAATVASRDARSSFGSGFWRLADPKISLASISALALGTMAAAARGPIDFPWLAATVAAVLAIEIAKNAYGEIVDFDSGTDLSVSPNDRTPFSGGKRVLVDGLLTRRQTAGIAAASYAAAIVIGTCIALFRTADAWWLGIAGIGCAYFYHAEPLKLSYRGLGEAAVGIAYGPLLCAGAYAVQRGEIAPELLWLSVPLGILIAAFLWINEFPDASADLTAGKRTLVARMGRRRASRVLCALVGTAFALLAAAPVSAGIPRTAWLGLLGLPFAIAACRLALRHPETTRALIPAQRNLLLSFVTYALGAGFGVLIH